MNKFFRLDDYFYKTSSSIKIFDILINDYVKKNSINKTDFLVSLGISQSSYNRALIEDKKIGNEILDKLYSFFEVPKLEASDKDKIEDLLSNIYLSFYYKKNINCYKDEILLYISKNSILTPILKLFLLLINTSNNSLDFVLKNFKELFDSITLYDKAYIDPYFSLYTLIKIIYEKNIDIKEVEKLNESIKPLGYKVLSSICLNKEKYIESLYYGLKAKNDFIRDLNYNRVCDVCMDIFQCYNYLGEYDKTLEEGNIIYNYIKFNPINDTFKRWLYCHLATALIGLKRYDESIRLLEEITDMNTNIMAYYLISLKLSNDKRYNDVYNQSVNDYVKTKECFIAINNFLTSKTKSNLSKIKEYSLNKGIFSIFEKMI